MANIKFKELLEGCTISLLVRDIESDRKNIRIFIKDSDDYHAVVQCEEEISNRLRSNTITIKELLECYYNRKDRMIELEDNSKEETINQTGISIDDIW
jgi:hypothetical protein